MKVRKSEAPVIQVAEKDIRTVKVLRAGESGGKTIFYSTTSVYEKQKALVPVRMRMERTSDGWETGGYPTLDPRCVEYSENLFSVTVNGKRTGYRTDSFAVAECVIPKGSEYVRDGDRYSSSELVPVNFI